MLYLSILVRCEQCNAPSFLNSEWVEYDRSLRFHVCPFCHQMTEEDRTIELYNSNDLFIFVHYFLEEIRSLLLEHPYDALH